MGVISGAALDSVTGKVRARPNKQHMLAPHQRQPHASLIVMRGNKFPLKENVFRGAVSHCPGSVVVLLIFQAAWDCSRVIWAGSDIFSFLRNFLLYGLFDSVKTG